MSKISLLCVLLFYPVLIRAQSINIKGFVQDTSKKIGVHNASVILINASDSLIIKDTRTEQGKFTLNSIKKGKYLLFVTYPEYVDASRALDIDGISDIDIGQIVLVPEAKLLQEVTVSAKRIPIKIRGDTTEYDAKAYHLAKNATVEDLLKKFQGFQVDAYGNISAQGKQVKHILVDGEEFFSDDPTLVTKSFRADMIDKVQLFDKKSDQAKFTGIEDGKSEKTVNLKLKKENKAGYFGKLDVGLLGTNHFRQVQALYNLFNNEEKFAVYGFSNNNGTLGLSKRDKEQFADNSGVTFNNYDLDSWSGQYDGKGIPDVIGAGTHYNNKFKNDKIGINFNYTFNRLKVDGENLNETQQILPSNLLLSKQTQQFDNVQNRNNINGEATFNVDSTSSFLLKVNGDLTHKETSNKYASETRNGQNTLLNSNNRLFSTSGDKKGIYADLQYLKKLNKDRRTLSLDLGFFNTSSNSAGALYSRTVASPTTFDADTIITNQLKQNRDNSTIVNFKVAYTEPITTSATIAFNAGVSNNKGKLERYTFDNAASQTSTVLDSSLSSKYRLNQFSKHGGISYNYSKNKLRVQLGSDVNNTRFRQNDEFVNSAFKRTFTFLSPSAEIGYDFTAYEGITFKYNGNATLPSLDQIQPLVNNNDPLNIVIGNPNLGKSFTNNFILSYIAFKQASDIFINVDGNISFINDPITTSISTDSAGINTYRYTNLKMQRNVKYDASFSFGAPTHFENIDFTIDGELHGNKYINIVNNQLSSNRLNIYNLRLGFGKAKDTIYNLGINFGVLYYDSKSNLEPQLNNNSWGYTIKPNFDFYLPGHITLHTEGNYLFQGKTPNFPTNFSRFIWNSYIQKDFLTERNLSIKLSANDLLNQNRGFDRYSDQNLIIQNTYTTVKRYFLFSVIWNFKKFKSQ